ncbi:unnamed protein product, partial [Symbiodinium sp. KB8]
MLESHVEVPGTKVRAIAQAGYHRHFRTVSLPSGMMGGSKYSAGVMAEGGTAYFVPYAADNIGVFDMHKEDFRTIDISSETSADCKYSGALVSDGIAYFIPSSASNVGVFNPTTESFRAVASLREEASSFRDGSSASNPGAPSSEFRVHLAQGIGRFLSGRLSGQATGSSGKDYNPPIVTSAFSRVKQLCFLGQSRKPVRGARGVAVLLLVSASACLVYLPSSALHRPVLAEVLAASEVDRRQPHPVWKVKTWIGILNQELVESVIFASGGEATTFGDADEGAEIIFAVAGSGGSAAGPSPACPLAASLTAIAGEHFSFHSAQEYAEGEEELGVPDRLAAVENAISELRSGIQALLDRSAPDGNKDAPANPGPKAKAGVGSRAGPAVEAGLPGLDPAVVKSARLAGIPEAQLEKMSKLVGGARKLPVEPRGGGLDPLDDEEEEDGAEARPGKGGGSELETVVVQMSRILQHMHKDKKPGNLEDVLDRADGGSDPSGASSSGGRSKAAAYQKLKSLLRSSPAEISKAVERCMSEDFTLSQSGPGLGQRPCTCRAWVEHRSLLQSFHGPIRQAWTLAGMVDAINDGDAELAKAIGLLGLASLDQAAVDGGSWLLASEISLEASPPFGAFGRPRTLDQFEARQTRLLDARWVSILMGRIREGDAYHAAKRSLGGGGGAGQPGGGAPNGGRDSPSTEGRPDPKGDKKGEKGGGRGVVWCRAKEFVFHCRSLVIWPSLGELASEMSGSKGARASPVTASWLWSEWFGPGALIEFIQQSPLALNALVLVLDWLFLGQPSVCRAELCLDFGQCLNVRQEAALDALRSSVKRWNQSPCIGPAEMGRAAAKFESLEDLLLAVERGLERFGWQAAKALTSVRLRLPQPCNAMAVDCDRIKLVGEPSFDPRPYLDNYSRSIYEKPMSFREPIPPETQVPRAQVRTVPGKRLGLLRALRDCKRLELVEASELLTPLRNGLFCVPKDEARDRLVLDARVPNLGEGGLDPWIQSLASLEQLQHVHLPASHDIAIYLEDLREFYHAFRVSRERCHRNALAMNLSASEVCELSQCCKSLSSGAWVPCLNTLAMGDKHAVGFGQTSHLAVVLRHSRLQLRDFVTLRGRPPRGPGPVAGLLIDDLVLLDMVEKGKPVESGPCASIIQDVRAGYSATGLPRHSGKAVEGASEGEFWGGHLDGRSGLLTPNLKRVVPLAFLVTRVVRRKVCCGSLLEAVGGALVSALQMRRRMLSLLDAVYAEQRNRTASDAFVVKGSLASELLCCGALLCLSEVDLRSEGCPWLVCSDASSTAEAAAFAPVPPGVSVELCRHGLQKGLWSRLLGEVPAYLKERGEEDLGLCELPASQYEHHPLLEVLCRSLQFFQLGPIVRPGRQRHINVGELRAALRAEAAVGSRHPGCRYFHVLDSQVATAALVKGRSASPALNSELRRSLPVHLSSKVLPRYGFIRSRFNPADDPTRNAPLRGPSAAAPSWWEAACLGDFGPLDIWLQGIGLHLDQLRELPPESELLADAPLSLPATDPKRRERRQQNPEGVAERMLNRASASASDLLVLFDRLPTEVNERNSFEGRRGLRFIAGAFIHGGVVGLTRSCRFFPGSVRAFCGYIRQVCPQLVFSSFTVLSNCRSAPHTDSHNLESEPNLVVPLSSFRHGEIWVESAGGSVPLEYKGVNCWTSPLARLFLTITVEPSRLPGDEIFRRFQAPRLGLEPVSFSLSGPAFDLLCKLPPGRFVFSQCFPDLRSALLSGQGWLDLFSGSRGLPKELVRAAPCWVLCYDILHEAGEDLLNLGIQREIAELILGGCFRGVSAGPVCSSFSCAVTPNWRSKEFPAGRPGLKTSQADKVRRGNAMLEFILNVVVLCERLEIVYIIENPLNSWLWAQPAWEGCKSRGGSWDFICDYCVFGTAWKKPTRFRTNGQLGGQRMRCSRDHRHLVLRGRVAGKGISASKLAEPYPRRLCVLLAQALAQDAKWIADKRPLDISRCAKCTNCRIGEAQNPGPGRRAPRPDVQLQDIQLVQPATAALQNSVWAKFLLWVKGGTDDDGVAHATANPELLVELLCAYGQVLYSSGAPLQHYRQIGEVLRATRSDLQTPRDLLREDHRFFLQIKEPKTKHRGPRVQHVVLDLPADIANFIQRICGDLPRYASLFYGSPAVYRKRWDVLLERLGISQSFRLTPGSLRGGGAVAAYQAGTDIPTLQWRMRLQHQATLAFYLQEVAAGSILPALPKHSREAIATAKAFLPVFIVPLPNPSSTPWKYRGGVILERTCYFAPHNADDIGMFDIDSLSFRSLDISETISIGRKFSDAFEHNGAVYFVPFNADAVGVLEIETEHFLLLDIATSISRNFKYWGAVPDRGLAYLVPYDADSIGLLHLDSESFVTIDISGKINADSKWFSSGILVNGAVYFIPGPFQSFRTRSLVCPMMDEWWRPEVGPFGFSGADAAVPRWFTAALCGFPADWHMDDCLPPKEVACYVALKEKQLCIVEQVDQKRHTWKIPLCEFIVGHTVLDSGDGHALTLRGTMLVINFDPWQYTRSDDSPQLCAEMLSCARQDEAELAKFLAELWVGARFTGLPSQAMSCDFATSISVLLKSSNVLLTRNLRNLHSRGGSRRSLHVLLVLALFLLRVQLSLLRLSALLLLTLALLLMLLLLRLLLLLLLVRHLPVLQMEHRVLLLLQPALLLLLLLVAELWHSGMFYPLQMKMTRATLRLKSVKLWHFVIVATHSTSLAWLNAKMISFAQRAACAGSASTASSDAVAEVTLQGDRPQSGRQLTGFESASQILAFVGSQRPVQRLQEMMCQHSVAILKDIPHDQAGLRSLLPCYVRLFYTGLIMIHDFPVVREVAKANRVSFTRFRSTASTLGQVNPHHDRLQVVQRLGNDLFSIGKEFTTGPETLQRVQKELQQALDCDPRIFEIIHRHMADHVGHLCGLVGEARNASDTLCAALVVSSQASTSQGYVRTFLNGAVRVADWSDATDCRIIVKDLTLHGFRRLGAETVQSAGSIGILQVDRGDPACHHHAEHRKRQEVAGSASPVVSAVGSDSFLALSPETADSCKACAVLVGAVICVLLTRGTSSKLRSLQPLLSGTLAVCVSALLFFVLRGSLDLLRQRPTPFWVELLPAMGFFLGLYGLLQVILLQDRSEEGSESLVLERPLPEAMMVCSGYIVLFTAVDAGGALAHFFGGSPLQVALSLPCFQLLLLGLDRLAGRLTPAQGGLRCAIAEVLCSGPIALLSVEVLSYAIRGHLGLGFLMTRRGQLEDGTAFRLPSTSDGLALLVVAALFLVASAWEALPLSQRSASSAAAVWTCLRGSRWIAKSWGWLPRVGSFRPELFCALAFSAAAILAGWLLERRARETRSARISSTSTLANGAI